MTVLNTICNITQTGTLNIFANWEIKGKQNVPQNCPLIIVSNHQSNFDSSLISVSIPREVRFLAKSEVFQNSISKQFLNWYGAYPLKRGKVDVEAMKWCLKTLREKKSLLIYPEGGRSPNKLSRGHSGVALIALKSMAPILPMSITGTAHLHSTARILNPTGNFTVNIGKPFTLDQIPTETYSKEILANITQTIMSKIANLLPESYRGEYA